MLLVTQAGNFKFIIVLATPHILFVNLNLFLGGHVGWFQGIFSPRRWYMKPTLEFLDALADF